MPNFYAGECERCGEHSDDRDCCYNSWTGEELYLCPACLAHVNDEEED